MYRRSKAVTFKSFSTLEPNTIRCIQYLDVFGYFNTTLWIFDEHGDIGEGLWCMLPDMTANLIITFFSTIIGREKIDMTYLLLANHISTFTIIWSEFCISSCLLLLHTGTTGNSIRKFKNIRRLLGGDIPVVECNFWFNCLIG